MPRYVVERTFAGGVGVPANAEGASASRTIYAISQEEGCTWVQSYVSTDKKTTFCVYDGPNPDAIRRAAQRNAMSVDRITEVRVLDPFFYYRSSFVRPAPPSRLFSRWPVPGVLRGDGGAG